MFAAVVGTGVLVLVLSWRLAFHPVGVCRRGPFPPDDWDDEEYIARHHR